MDEKTNQSFREVPVPGKKLSGEVTDQEIEEELPLEGIPFVHEDVKKTP